MFRLKTGRVGQKWSCRGPAAALWLGVLGTGIVRPGPAWGIGLQWPLDGGGWRGPIIHGLTRDGQRVSIGSEGTQGDDSGALLLYHGAQLSDEDAVRRFLQTKVGSLVAIHILRDENPQGFGGHLEDTFKSQGAMSVSFAVNDVPFCFYGARATVHPDGQLTLMGYVPPTAEMEVSPTPVAAWPTQELALETALSAVGEAGGRDVVSSSGAGHHRCYLVDSGELRPVWKNLIQKGRDLYATYSDEGQLWAAEPLFFHATGSARVYPSDPVSTPNLESVSLNGLVGDGSLSTTELVTAVPTGVAQVSRSDHRFDFDPSTPAFLETSVFVNAVRHLAHVKGLGFAWYGSQPLLLRIAGASMPNNARFLPVGGSKNGPVIDIGRGEGGILRNLEVDSGVVAHELGHFVVYRHLTKTSGESLVLHEALADYFEATRSGDGCLAESICPTDSLACVVRGRCLRTADNGFKYGDKNWMGWMSSTGQYSHLHAQVFSGLLWSVRQGAAAGSSLFDTVVMRAISALPQEGGFTDFLKALEQADKQYAAGQDLALLSSQINLRNLSEFATIDVGQGGDPVIKSLPDTGGQPREAVSVDQPRTQRGRGSQTPSCGVVGVERFPLVETILLFIIPCLALNAGRAPRRVYLWVDFINKNKYKKRGRRD